MAKYIMSILKTQLMIMWSWGTSNFMALPNNEGLIFHVQVTTQWKSVPIMSRELDSNMHLCSQNEGCSQTNQIIQRSTSAYI